MAPSLDMLHLFETMVGADRVRQMTVEEALRLKDDTVALLEGRMSPADCKQAWEAK